MASNGLAQAFTRLSTSDSRLNALEALIKELTPYEWRFVRSVTSARTFQFDIVGRLPVELVSQIFSYLDTSTPWRLQLVSRSWLEKLRSPVVLKTNLDSWYDGAVNLQSADLNFFGRKARSVHAFRSASQSALPDSSFRISTPSIRGHTLVGDTLIWLQSERVHVLNMRSWKHRVITSAARLYIREVIASDEIVAFTVMDHTVYVAELNRQGPLKRFRVVCTKSWYVLTCRQRTVAYAGYLENGILVYIWSFDTQQGKSFSISYEDPILSACHIENIKHELPGISLLLQPDTETIVLCLLDACRSQDASSTPKIWYYRFTYAGQCLHSAAQPLDGYDRDNHLKNGHGRSYRFVPASHNGLFMLQDVIYSSWSVASRTLRTLQFDESLRKFTSSDLPGLDSTSPTHPGHIVWWKDTLIEAGIKEHIVVHRGTTSDPCYDRDITYNHLEPGQGLRRQLDDSNGKDLLVNDMYIVRPYCNAFYVYCYDHTVQLPGKEGTLVGVGPWEMIDADFAKVDSH